MTVPRLTGSVTAAAPTADATELLVLLPSLGTTTELWDGVVAALRPALPAVRVLHVDLPGHGASPAARDPFTIAELAEGVLRVVDEVGGGRFHVAGDSLGGTVALELAVAASARVASLTMVASGARIGTADGWAERAASVRASGTASLVGGSAQRWFAPGYLEREPDGPGGRALRLLVDVDDESYARCCEALGAFDRTVEAAGLTVPVLLVAGGHDGVTTTEAMRSLAAEVPGGRFVELAGSAHLPPLDRPAEVAALIAEHVRSTGAAAGGDTATDAASDPDAATDSATRGMAVRRAVLGDAHVDAATAAITAETAPFQDFITRYAWGEIWARPDLSRRERSIATLASLVTGGHEAELRMHVRAARRNGLGRAEIAEVIMHTALYAGLPSANTALGIAREVFADEPDPDEPDPDERDPEAPHPEETDG